MWKGVGNWNSGLEKARKSRIWEERVEEMKPLAKGGLYREVAFRQREPASVARDIANAFAGWFGVTFTFLEAVRVDERE